MGEITLEGSATLEPFHNVGGFEATVALAGAGVQQVNRDSSNMGAVAAVEGSITVERSAYRKFEVHSDDARIDRDVHAETRWTIEHWRGGRIIWEDSFDNLVVTAGLNELLDATFVTGVSEPTWYVGLIAGDAIDVIPGDTMASHPGWSEFVSYDEVAGRPAYVPGAPVEGEIDNVDSRAVFTISLDDQSVGGLFLTSDDGSQSAETGILYGAGAFYNGARAVDQGDVLRVTAAVNLSVST